MCCTLAVILVPYFRDVGGRLKRTRDDKELLKSIFKLKTTVEYLRVYIVHRSIGLVNRTEGMSNMKVGN